MQSRRRIKRDTLSSSGLTLLLAIGTTAFADVAARICDGRLFFARQIGIQIVEPTTQELLHSIASVFFIDGTTVQVFHP